jgi:hypothetical protein
VVKSCVRFVHHKDTEIHKEAERKKVTMGNNHIPQILDEKPLTAFSESELESIRAHNADCADCARAFKAAELSQLLVKTGAGEAAANALNANPFFQTRVLAAWREQRESGWSFGRLWKATGALVSSMVVTTAALAALTFIVPAEEATTTPTAAASRSAESVMFDQTEDEMTNEQALNAIYYDEEDAR